LHPLEKAVKFLENLADFVAKPVQENLELISRAKKEKEGTAEVFQWDIAYYTAQLKARKFPLVNSSVKEYFPIGACMEGVAIVVNRLFGLQMEVEQVAKGEIWHPSVRKIAVREEDGSLVGFIYCDLLARSSKNFSAGHFTLRW